MPEIHKVKVQNTEYDLYDSRFGTSATPTIPQEVLTVTVTFDPDTDEPSIDSTYTDIINAINSNKLICFTAEGHTTTDVRLEESIIYAHFLDLYNEEAFYISVDSSNAVAVQGYDIPGTEIIQSDWIESSSYAPTFIKNKPAVFVGSGTGAVVLNRSNNQARGNYSISEGQITASGDQTLTIDGVTTTYHYGASGIASHSEGSNTVASGFASHAEGSYSMATNTGSHAEGNGISTGPYAHAEGAGIAIAHSSHAEGFDTMARGTYSHAEGNNSVANGRASHAEGEYTCSEGDYTHTEGVSSIAHLDASHVEGTYNVVIARNSHAEGVGVAIVCSLSPTDANSTSYTLSTPVEVSNTNLLSLGGMYVVGVGKNNASMSSIVPEKITSRTISGNSLTGFTVANTLYTTTFTTAQVRIILKRVGSDNAHVEGLCTVSNTSNQHVSGKWNVQTDGAEVIGNGTDDLNRSNIRTLDWNGNEVLAGKLTVGATPTANMDVTTKQYVDNAISNVGGLTATVSNNTLFLTM